MAQPKFDSAILGGRIIDPAQQWDGPGTVLIGKGRIVAIERDAAPAGFGDDIEQIDAHGAVVAPGLVDIGACPGTGGQRHADFATLGTMAATGGITTLALSAHADPPIDDPARVTAILQNARNASPVTMHVIGAMTRGLRGEKMSEIGLMREAGAIAFGDGARAVQNSQTLRRILAYARGFNALIIHQGQDDALAADGAMNEGLRASWLGLPASPKEAEIIGLERDLRLVGLTGGRYHARAISCAESAYAVRSARQNGADVSAGVSINHLTFNENDIGGFDPRFKLDPPLRSEDDRLAMIDALAGGTLDIIISDHAPASQTAKRLPFVSAASGVSGLTTLLPAALRLVHGGALSLPRLIAALSTNPARRLGLNCGHLRPGAAADLVIFEPDTPWVWPDDDTAQMPDNTLFAGAQFLGRVKKTLVGGKTIYQAPDIEDNWGRRKLEKRA